MNNRFIIPRAEKQEIRFNCKVKFLPNDRYKLSCFSFGAFRERGYEEHKKCDDKCYYGKNWLERYQVEANQVPHERNDTAPRADSLKRAKDKIFEIALANDWNYMVTFTLDKEKINRYEPHEVKKAVGTWLHNQVQRRCLSYLFVPELHKDGAIHFHGLVSNGLEMAFSETYKIDGDKKPRKLSTLKKRGLTPDSEGVHEVYNVKNFPYGFSTAVKLDENAEAVAMYMTKYITKDLNKIFGNFYLCGGNIRRELPFQLLRVDYDSIENAKEVSVPNMNGSVKYLTLSGEEFEKVLEMIQ